MTPPTYIYCILFENPQSGATFTYTGITKDMDRRMTEHRNKKSISTKRYLKKNIIDKIMYKRIYDLSYEKTFKKYGKFKKLKLMTKWTRWAG